MAGEGSKRRVIGSRDLDRIGSALDAALITLSDTVDVVEFGTELCPRSFIATAAGTVTVTTFNGNKVAIPVLAGVPVQLVVLRFWSTGTAIGGGTVVALL